MSVIFIMTVYNDCSLYTEVQLNHSRKAACSKYALQSECSALYAMTVYNGYSPLFPTSMYND